MPVSELASSWDKVIISWIGTDPLLSNKAKYSTLARTLGPFDKMATFLLDIFK